MERGEPIVYPPIHEFINQWGELAYRVVIGDRTATIQLGDPLPREEAHETVRRLLMRALMDGRYEARHFYRQYADDIQLSHAAMDGHGLEETAYGHGCFGGIPASGEAIIGLPEASVKKGECSVCLEDFEAGDKLRMMPCSHSFHEHCIFNWLRLSHVCPLCRLALPTEEE